METKMRIILIVLAIILTCLLMLIAPNVMAGTPPYPTEECFEDINNCWWLTATLSPVPTYEGQGSTITSVYATLKATFAGLLRSPTPTPQPPFTDRKKFRHFISFVAK